jgi:glycosyltransferase involved in cell wall biosynthesis
MILKIAWDNCYARKNQGGSGVYAARLLEQIQQRDDVAVTVFDGWPKNSNGGGITTRAFRTAGNLLWIHAHLPGILLKDRFDVLHSPAFMAPISAPCPTVITVHDVTHLLYPSHFAGWWGTYMDSVAPKAIRTAAAIVCGSEHSKADIMKAYGLPASRVRAVPYGVDHDRFHPGVSLDAAWASSLGIRDGYLLHVGVFSHRKNIPMLLRAVAQLRSKGSLGNRQVVLAGSESPGVTGAAEIYDTIQQLELSGTVVLTGRVPDQHIPGLYAHAAALIMPSLYEGFGFPVLESMAIGTPVVASSSSSLPEVAGDAALLVSPHDQNALASAIENVIQNRSTAEELRRRGLLRARQFNWQRTAEETVQVYKDVARNRI